MMQPMRWEGCRKEGTVHAERGRGYGEGKSIDRGRPTCRLADVGGFIFLLPSNFRVSACCTGLPACPAPRTRTNCCLVLFKVSLIVLGYDAFPVPLRKDVEGRLRCRFWVKWQEMED